MSGRAGDAVSRQGRRLACPGWFGRAGYCGRCQRTRSLRDDRRARPTLTTERNSAILSRLSRGRRKGHVAVVAGTGTNCTAKTLERSKEAMAAGADGVMLVAPVLQPAEPRRTLSAFQFRCRACPVGRLSLYQHSRSDGRRNLSLKRSQPPEGRIIPACVAVKHATRLGRWRERVLSKAGDNTPFSAAMIR